MRESYEKVFPMTVGLEGHLSFDKNDPGNRNPDGTQGFTVYGLASRFHKNISITTTLDEAKNIYLYEYWIPAGCDAAPKRMDACLFDSQTNPQNDPKLPGGGNQEIMNLNPENWQDYMIFRMARYMRCSAPEYVKGHIFRCLKLHQQIKDLL